MRPTFGQAKMVKVLGKRRAKDRRFKGQAVKGRGKETVVCDLCGRRVRKDDLARHRAGATCG